MNDRNTSQVRHNKVIMKKKTDRNESSAPISLSVNGSGSIIILLHVNGLLQKMTLLKHLLEKQSIVFNTCFEKAENADIYCARPDMLADTLPTIINWMQSDTITIPNQYFARAFEGDEASWDSPLGPYGFLVELWLAASKHQIKDLKNAVIDAFAHLHLISNIPIRITSYMRQQEGVDPTLYVFLVELLARSLSPTDLEACKSELSADCVFDIAHFFLRSRAERRLHVMGDPVCYHSGWEDICAEYHCHDGVQSQEDLCESFKKLDIKDKWMDLLSGDGYSFCDGRCGCAATTFQ